MDLRRIGGVFETNTLGQYLFTVDWRVADLVEARQQLNLSRLDGASQYGGIASSLLRNTKGRVTCASCLLIDPGMYHFAWMLDADSAVYPLALPTSLTTAYSPEPIGVSLKTDSLLKYSVEGTSNLYTVISGRHGDRIYTRARIRYTITAGEKLVARVLVKNLRTGTELSSDENILVGPDAGILETGALPLILENQDAYQISLIANTASLTHLSWCELIQSCIQP